MRIVLAAVLATAATVVPAAAQRTASVPPSVYATRRASLMTLVDGGAVVVPGKYLIGNHELPRQDATFWYLTGVHSPYAILVMAPDRRAGAPRGAFRTALFLPDSVQFAGAQFPMADGEFRGAVWNRPANRLSPGTVAARVTGISELYPVDEFAERLTDIIGESRVIYVPLPTDSLYAPRGLARALTVEQQFAASVSARMPGRALRNVSPLVTQMRLVKDVYEIAALREAASISAHSMVTLMRAVKPGMNDLEAAGVLEADWKRRGSTRAAFAPIIGSGENSMRFFTVQGEQYDAVNRTMKAGDLLFVDYGAAEVRMYTSDICRTIPVSGRFTADQRKYYDMVLEAQEAAIAAVRPGVMMVNVIKAAASVFRRHGLERFENVATMGVDSVWGIMPSPTHYLARDAGITKYTRYGAGVRDIGHHIGLEVTDSRDWTRPLEAGMVLTIEPKLYIPSKQIAIMIEDMILVTANGSENLSAAAPKKAAEIEAIMAGRR